MIFGIFLYLVVAFIIFFNILKRDRIYAIFIAFTCLYSIVPLVNVTFYKGIVILHGYCPSVTTTPILFLIYILITLVFLYIAHYLVIGNYYAKTMKEESDSIRIGKIVITFGEMTMRNIAKLFVLMYAFYILLYLRQNISSINYANQGSFIFQFFTSLFGIISYVLFFNERKGNENKLLKFYAVMIMFMALAYAFIAGERGSILIYFIGMGYVYIERNHKKSKRIKGKNVLIILGLTVILIYLSQLVRIGRGSDSTVNIGLEIIFNFFQPQAFLFQDYATPGLELMYVIENNIIRPDWAILSFLGNGIVIFDYPSLGLQLPLPGFANFAYIEGYMLLGWLGAIFYPFILCFWFRLYYKMFMSSGSRNYKIFIGYLMATFFTIHLIRGGETFAFLKSIYMYFIPASMLYKMINGKSVDKFVPHSGTQVVFRE